MGLLCSKEKILSVDDERKKKRKERIRGFSPALFTRNEFDVLKAFCHKYGIKQADLVIVYTSYLSSDEAHLRDFRVKILDLKLKFLQYSKLDQVFSATHVLIDVLKCKNVHIFNSQEIADIFFPAIFMQNINSLADAYSSEEVSFTRFVITMFLFCGQHTPDLISELFAVLKKNFALKLESKMFYFNLSEVLTVFAEISDSFASKVLLQAIQQQPKEKEVSIGSIVKFGVKYPVLFYALERFKKKCRRFIFGDKFWKTKKFLKFKAKEALRLHSEVKTSYQTMESAVAFSAASAITDAINGYEQIQSDGRFQVTDTLYKPQDQVAYISEEDAVILKDVFGYKSAKRLVAESGLPFAAADLRFLSGFERDGDEKNEDEKEEKEGEGEEKVGREDNKKKEKKLLLTVLDKVNDRHFIHDPETGETAWGQQLLQPDGAIFKEIFLHHK